MSVTSSCPSPGPLAEPVLSLCKSPEAVWAFSLLPAPGAPVVRTGVLTALGPTVRTGDARGSSCYWLGCCRPAAGGRGPPLSPKGTRGPTQAGVCRLHQGPPCLRHMETLNAFRAQRH